MSFTDKLLERFPEGSYGYSTDHKTWQIFDKQEIKDKKGNDISGRRLLISIGVFAATGDVAYVYYAKGKQFSGKTDRLNDLYTLIPVIGY